jgi:hypothetical protein
MYYVGLRIQAEPLAWLLLVAWWPASARLARSQHHQRALSLSCHGGMDEVITPYATTSRANNGGCALYGREYVHTM